jgi:biotin carboxyl carrier protein
MRDELMKMYRVNVNGNVYEITLEVVDAAEVKAAPAPAAAPAPVAAPAPAAVPAGGEKINAPMPGTILAVNVSNGSVVKKGDVLVVLEAMKMENEIMAPCDGTVNSLSVTKGASVESGALICALN